MLPIDIAVLVISCIDKTNTPAAIAIIGIIGYRGTLNLNLETSFNFLFLNTPKNVNTINIHIENIATSESKLNCPLKANNADITHINKIEFLGALYLLSSNNLSLFGKMFSPASAYKTLDPVKLNALAHPNTDIIIPIPIILPAELPNNSVATANPGDCEFARVDAGRTFK